MSKRILKHIIKQCKSNSIAELLEALNFPEIGNIINTTYNGTTPLWMSCIRSSIDVVDILIEHGADPNMCSVDHNELPIHAACEGDWFAKEKCLKLLGINNHNLNTPRGETYVDRLPTSIAASKGNEELVQMLLDRGAHYHIIGQSLGSGPLHAAATRGNIGILHLL